MPNPIKAFFDKKKAEARFKSAGPGQKLGDSSQAAANAAARREHAAAVAQQRAQGAAAGPSREMSNAQRNAAQAALSRISQDQERADFSKSRSQAAIRAQALKQMEQEKKVTTPAYSRNLVAHLTIKVNLTD